MDKNMEKLLDKIGFDTNNYQYFSDAKISKIKVNSKNGNWNVFVEKSSLLPLEIYTELEEKKNLLLDANEQESTVHFIYEIENTDLDLYKEYYSYLLKLLKPELKVLEIYEDCLRV